MESFELLCTFPVSSKELYDAWLNSEKHSKFTGGLAAIEGKENTFYTAWDGYITGKILELDDGRRIYQTWRTTEFDTSDESSFLEITLLDHDNVCELTLKHTNIPDGQGDQYKTGWSTHYFEPMTKYFSEK